MQLFYIKLVNYQIFNAKHNIEKSLIKWICCQNYIYGLSSGKVLRHLSNSMTLFYKELFNVLKSVLPLSYVSRPAKWHLVPYY